MTKEVFVFTSTAKRKLLLLSMAGIVLIALGIIILVFGGHANEASGEEAGHAFHWSHRLFVDLWINNIYFIGLALIGVFFFSIQYAAQAGWSASIIRVPLSLGSWLPFAFILLILVFFIANFTGHWHLFHWLDQSLYEPTLPDGSLNPNYDSIIAGKEPFLQLPFYLTRMVIFFIVWIGMFLTMRRINFSEDHEMNVGDGKWKKLVTLSAIFIIFFALSSSVASWDWVMSVDTHWFSTMFGWYVFASWFAAGISLITLMVLILKENGYLPMVTADHLHDLGKFVFAFSIFWTYIWFSQFLLIYYANIPEESIYFVERLQSDHYAPVFFLNLILNFFFPFLVLMTRD
jgi:hypothetical protein